MTLQSEIHSVVIVLIFGQLEKNTHSFVTYVPNIWCKLLLVNSSWYTLIWIDLHWSALVYVHPHSSAFIYIHLHSSAFHLHSSVLICIDLSSLAFIWVDLHIFEFWSGQKSGKKYHNVWGCFCVLTAAASDIKIVCRTSTLLQSNRVEWTTVFLCTNYKQG